MGSSAEVLDRIDLRDLRLSRDPTQRRPVLIEILVTRTEDGFNYIAGDMHGISK
jgi:hypothetical protein